MSLKGGNMPLKQSSTKEALNSNIAEMITTKRKGKFGKNKARQMAIAAAFAVKEKAQRRK